MNRKEQEKYHAIGEDYWWLVGKYRLVLDQIARHLPRHQNLSVLDVGCGPGNTLDRLRDYGQGFGMDRSSDAAQFCRRRGHRVFVGDAQTVPLADDVFDLVVALDVIEHVDNDQQALDHIFRVLKPGGTFVMTVPVFMLLWGDHDDLYLHKRRYRIREIRAVMERAGFRITKLSCIEPLFFIPLLIYRKAKRLLPRQTKSDDFVSVPRWLNCALGWLIGVEKYWLRWFNFPLGVSSICVAQKPAVNAVTRSKPITSMLGKSTAPTNSRRAAAQPLVGGAVGSLPDDSRCRRAEGSLASVDS